MLTNCHQNFASGADNKSVTSADLEMVVQGYHLHKSVNLGYYTGDFNQIFSNKLLLALTTKVSHQLTLKG